MSNKKRVVIIGGGFAGLSAAKELGDSEFEVILFDKTNHHLFQPLLYQVASAALSPGDIAVPIREVLSPFKNITVLMEKIDAINADASSIQTISGDSVKYDYLIIATGARHSYFGHPEWEKFAPGMKTLNDALHIRNNLLDVYEQAEISHKDSLEPINFVVIGAGPTGVEMAGALAEISKQTLINDFRRIDSSMTKIYLIEGAPQILGMYPASLAQKAQRYLEQLGVIVLTQSLVTHIDAEQVEIGEKKIKTKNIIWAAGNKASSLLESIGCELDCMGRAIVDSNLKVSSHKNVFVLGDAAHFAISNDQSLPGLAPVASQQGRYVGQYLLGKTEKPFNYFDKGSMATIGKFKAVLKKDKIEIAGFPAWLAWCFVHILFLIDFRNKLLVFAQWAITFFFSKRGVRIINK